MFSPGGEIASALLSILFTRLIPFPHLLKPSFKAKSRAVS